MIRQATTPRAKLRFYNACRGKLCLGATMPLALELLGKSQPGRFFAGPTLALDIGGSTAWMAGHANPEELAGFLTFCGCSAVVLDEAEAAPPARAGHVQDPHHLRPDAGGGSCPMPEADDALWASLTFDRSPRLPAVAEGGSCPAPACPAGRLLFRARAPSAAGAGPRSGRVAGEDGVRLPPPGPTPLPNASGLHGLRWKRARTSAGHGACGGRWSCGWRANSAAEAAGLSACCAPRAGALL